MQRNGFYHIHPVLFALYPTLAIYSHNIQQVTLGETALPLCSFLVLSGILYLSLRLLFRDAVKAAIAASVCLMSIFLYGPVFDLAHGLSRQSSATAIHIALLPSSLLLVAGCFVQIIRLNKSAIYLTKVLNYVSLAMILLPLLNIAAYKIRVDRNAKHVAGMCTSELTGGQAPYCPDVYYIILDRYPRADILRNIYQYDNSDFMNYLRDRGFYVARESNANYLCTAQSLASSLNLKHITSLQNELGPESDDWTPVYAMLQDSEVVRFFKSRGYTYIHLGSEWHPTSRNRNADIHYNRSTLSEFSMLVLRSTMLYPIARGLGVVQDHCREKYERVLYQFDRLAEVPKMEESTFVFAHFLMPHNPYVFDANGEYVSPEEARLRSTRDAFVHQVCFLNRKVKDLVDTLLTESRSRPIIILQADEGPYPLDSVFKEHGASQWIRATNDQLKEKMGILNAYHMPDAEHGVLYPSITPVNTFRVVFNEYFGLNLEFLPDTSYVFWDVHHLYRFIDVTAKLKDRAAGQQL